MHQGGLADVGLHRSGLAECCRAGRAGWRSGRAERSTHESGEAFAAWQVDAPASLQQLVPHHLQLVVECGGAQQGAEGRDLIVTS